MINLEQARLLYSIGKGHSVNIEVYILRSIVKHVGVETLHGTLPFPSLIYNILVSQGFVKKRYELLIPPSRELTISLKLVCFEVRINDLLTIHGSVPPDVGTSSNALAVSDSNLYDFFEKQMQYLRAKENEILAMLASLKGKEKTPVISFSASDSASVSVEV